MLVEASSPEEVRARHEAIAESAILAKDDYLPRLERQNLLSGAIIIGDISTVRSVLLRDGPESEKATVSGTTPHFWEPLTLAASKGHQEIVQFLLDNGARLETQAELWWQDRHDLAQLADWNLHDERRHHTVLHSSSPSALRAAISGGHTGIVHLLLRLEHRLPTTSLEYLRAILTAAKVGRKDIMELVFDTIDQQLSDFENLGKFIMWEAIRGDQAEIVQWVLDHGVDVNACPVRDYYPIRGTLHLAASLGRTRLVELLLNRGANAIDGPPRGGYGGLPVEGAAMRGQRDAVELLLSHGADPARALYAAAAGSQSWLIKHLLSNHPQLTDEITLRTCFHFAIASCSLTAMTILVQAGASLNDCYEDDGVRLDTPINKALKQHGFSWVGEHLISLGAYPTDAEWASTRTSDLKVREVVVTKRTWDWVGRY
ncbi:unnamed protein product [Zymoseptoria tritici ST99CH_3D1]|uniref:Uncharacterized protein n=1 Tax=Zymoseptoria tritici (strain ST99CH_3D7) TaxID=1276538 RepID=A0A1X7RS26_ZYMT9|nr:unnamed protein product [Zymoseptoria tritici ST99CH_3D7]SMR52237.1 unnamed protein product [Zymoseptoria tritici ST99CH_3D1]